MTKCFFLMLIALIYLHISGCSSQSNILKKDTAVGAISSNNVYRTHRKQNTRLKKEIREYKKSANRTDSHKKYLENKKLRIQQEKLDLLFAKSFAAFKFSTKNKRLFKKRKYDVYKIYNEKLKNKTLSRSFSSRKVDLKYLKQKSLDDDAAKISTKLEPSSREYTLKENKNIYEICIKKLIKDKYFIKRNNPEKGLILAEYDKPIKSNSLNLKWKYKYAILIDISRGFKNKDKIYFDVIVSLLEKTPMSNTYTAIKNDEEAENIKYRFLLFIDSYANS